MPIEMTPIPGLPTEATPPISVNAPPTGIPVEAQLGAQTLFPGPRPAPAEQPAPSYADQAMYEARRIGEPMEPVQMQQGGLVNDAMRLQGAGRGGDNMLVHMNPEEVGALDQLGASGLGGLRQARMTVNPNTGLPEMFNFRDLLPTIAGIAVTAMGGGPLVAGLAAGGTSLASQEGDPDIGRALMAGIGAWGGAELGQIVGSGGTGLEASQFSPAGTASMPQVSLDPSGTAPLFGPTQITSKLTMPTGLTPEAAAAARGVAETAGATGQQMFDAARQAQYASGGLPTGPGRLDMIGKGLDNISGSWTAPPGSGKIGLGELAKPLAATTMGTMGSMPPPEWDFPEAEEYDDTPLPPAEWSDREYVEPPADYRPGVDPEWEYWQPRSMMAYNGYRGRDDLPTVNAQGGGVVGQLEQLGGDVNTVGGGVVGQLEQLGGEAQEFSDSVKSTLGGGGQSPLGQFGESPQLSPLMDPGPIEHRIRGRRGHGDSADIYRRKSTSPFGPPMARSMFRDGSEGMVVGDVGLPTVNAKFGWKDAASIVSPAYGIGRAAHKGGGLGALMGGILPQLLMKHYKNKDRDIGEGSPEDVSDPSSEDLLQQAPETGWKGDDIMSSLYSNLPPGYQRASFQLGTEGMMVEEAAAQQLPPGEAAAVGIMEGAPPPAQEALEERMAVMPSPDQPQNPEERAIFDQALLALQGMLDPEVAKEAIDEFIDTFGEEAYYELIALVENDLDEGGIVKPANGETTVAMGDVQGPDMIPGNIVDPMTGEKTANLNVGENEYIEPAPSLARRAMAAGMPPTPENGALVRGAEEDELEAMYG